MCILSAKRRCEVWWSLKIRSETAEEATEDENSFPAFSCRKCTLVSPIRIRQKPLELLFPSYAVRSFAVASSAVGRVLVSCRRRRLPVFFVYPRRKRGRTKKRPEVSRPSRGPRQRGRGRGTTSLSISTDTAGEWRTP